MFGIVGKLRQYRAMLADILILRSPKLFEQPREFYFHVFKKNYPVYRKWIEPQKQSLLPIDVIIPAIDKDLCTLPYVIKGVRQHVKHPIRQIYIVAPASAAIQQVAHETACVFINEQDVCNISKQEINFIYNGHDRSGWIYQQLLKLNFDRVGTEGHHLVIDADTVLIQDTAFEKNGRLYFDFSDEYHKSYYLAYEMLTGLKHIMPVSFVSHYMLFNKQLLRELRSHIETYTSVGLEEAVISLKHTIIDQSNFSEYETYANYCLAKDRYMLRYFHNRNLDLLPTAEIIKKESNGLYKSLSFHAYSQAKTKHK